MLSELHFQRAMGCLTPSESKCARSDSDPEETCGDGCSRQPENCELDLDTFNKVIRLHWTRPSKSCKGAAVLLEMSEARSALCSLQFIRTGTITERADLVVGLIDIFSSDA